MEADGVKFTYELMGDMEYHSKGGNYGGKDDVSESKGGEEQGGNKLVIIKRRTRSQTQVK